MVEIGWKIDSQIVKKKLLNFLWDTLYVYTYIIYISEYSLCKYLLMYILDKHRIASMNVIVQLNTIDSTMHETWATEQLNGN